MRQPTGDISERSAAAHGTAAHGATSRRGFLKGAAIAAGALLVPVSLARDVLAAEETSYEITDWIRLEPNGRTIIGLSQCEVG